MAAIKKVKKAQRGMQLDSTGKPFPKANVPASARTPTAPPPRKPSTSGIIMKSKKGGKFDLNKDGKTTFKDVLIGRGVLPKNTAKKGMKVKKAQAGDTLPKAEIPMKKTKPSSNVSKIKVAMKKGGKMTKKCAYGCK